MPSDDRFFLRDFILFQNKGKQDSVSTESRLGMLQTNIIYGMQSLGDEIRQPGRMSALQGSNSILRYLPCKKTN